MGHSRPVTGLLYLLPLSLEWSIKVRKFGITKDEKEEGEIKSAENLKEPRQRTV